MTEDLNQDIDDLDSSWLEEFDKIDNEYKIYYTEELSFIKVNSIYINKNNEIEKLKEEKIILKMPGTISKEELISAIKHNSFINEKKYSLLSILKFNINIDPLNLKNFIKSTDPNIGNNYFHLIKNIDSIKLDKSIGMFHDINELFILFYEKNNNLVVNSENLSKNVMHIITQKHKLNSNTKKKTIKKQFKEMTT